MDELTISAGGRTLTLEPGRLAQVGRSTTCDLVVDDPQVSREHLRIGWDGDHWGIQCLGRSGTYVNGMLVTYVPVAGAVELHLSAPGGPAVFVAVVAAPSNGPAQAVAPQPAAAVAPPVAGVPPGLAVIAGVPSGPAGPPPPDPGPRPVTGSGLAGAFKMLMPIKDWVRDPAMRQWQRIVVALYAIVPLILLITLQHTTNLETLGWVYCLYVAPLWAIVFWYLIRPGPIGLRDLVILSLVVAAEFILIPVLTIPWEKALGPSEHSHNLLAWIYGVGLAEELTKAIPIMVIAIVLLKWRKTKLDVRMWMFLATISGLIFGVYEASTNYVPGTFLQTSAQATTVILHLPRTATPTTIVIIIDHVTALGIPSFVERVFLDGFQHAMWAGIAGFFIGLGTNYGRQRIPLWAFGIAVPTVLHGLNDWSVSGVFGNDQWPWIIIQALSLALFLGYTVSARQIERSVRRTGMFRGQSMYLDESRLADPPSA